MIEQLTNGCEFIICAKFRTFRCDQKEGLKRLVSRFGQVFGKAYLQNLHCDNPKSAERKKHCQALRSLKKDGDKSIFAKKPDTVPF
ncbi:MAG: hypothetical protein A3H82_00090 [Candidatus Levybacteria bacterium RIFCSPLOWO2_02_FULL_39_26]|nr:MAG: hypothetical protein A3H82_00090 [Candidatus Levybacteria bacterium RIFCSPLOWO2_02_FULL_39_26]